MSAEIVNLRRVRKVKLRAEKAAEGATNRALHGRTRAERDIETLGRARAARGLDNHRLERGPVERAQPERAEDDGAAP